MPFHSSTRLIVAFLFAHLMTTSAFAASDEVAAPVPPRQLPPPQLPPPNVVIIFADDLGYGDLGCYGGAQGYQTPHIDRMAAEGVRFTDFYVAAPACSPSRAALLTGCYPPRVGVTRVLSPASETGLADDEITIAEVLKDRGYATACVGKWHLGHHDVFGPMKQGFDTYFGLPYSNDMSPDPRNNPAPRARSWPPLPLLRGSEVIEREPDQAQLTRRYTEEGVRFIEQNRDKPFFLYLAHSMPHVPLYASEAFAGKSARGLFGDVMEELDWSVGQILQALQRLKLDERTLVIFTSDNGPWLIKKEHAGSSGPLRDGKATVYEGGVRVPCVMRWPGTIPAGATCREIASTIDLLPTLAQLTGGAVPQDRVIDGKELGPLLRSPTDAESPHEAFFYWTHAGLQAVRSGEWKLHLPRREGNRDMPLRLYNLRQDIGEANDVAEQHPEVVAKLRQLAQEHAQELKANARPSGTVGGGDGGAARTSTAPAGS